MNPQYIDLYEHEARALADKRLGVLVRVVEPQPDREVREMCHLHEGLWFAYIKQKYGQHSEHESPFVPGAVLGCREEWADWTGQRIVYKTDELPDGLQLRWRSAKSMPNGAIRFRVTVGEVRCVRAQSLSVDEISAWGITFDSLLHGPDSYAEAQELLAAQLASIHGAGSWDSNPWLWLATTTPTE